MYIVMNRFKIKRGYESTFIDIWAHRDSRLKEMPGFIRFHLLQGSQTETYTLFSSFTEWASQHAFEQWTQSEAFNASHRNAGHLSEDIYIGPPQLDKFTVIG